MPSIHPFYGFAGLEYAQALSAFIHQWGAGIIKNHFYTKDVSRVEEETREMGRVAASETTENKANTQPEGGGPYSAHNPEQQRQVHSGPNDVRFHLHPDHCCLAVSSWLPCGSSKWGGRNWLISDCSIDTWIQSWQPAGGEEQGDTKGHDQGLFPEQTT